MRRALDAVTTDAAPVMGLQGFGLKVDCHGDLIVLPVRDAAGAIWLKALELFIVRRGKVVSETPPRIT